MRDFELVNIPRKCSNLNCTNEVTEGGFDLVRLYSSGHQFPIMFFLCRPCAQAVVPQ